jgi:hypothetical protein
MLGVSSILPLWYSALGFSALQLFRFSFSPALDLSNADPPL